MRYERRGAAAVVTIDRPERRNAVDRAMLDQLAGALGVAADRPARVVMLTGTGGSFSAGADLTVLDDEGLAQGLRAVLVGLTEFPACTMAAVDGPALGAGTQLALACDVRVASGTSRFGVPAARLGLVVDPWTVQRLVALAGGGTARSVLLAAESLSAPDAHRLGLVQRLGDLTAALAWAAEIAALAPLSVAAHKVAVEHLDDSAVVRAAREAAWTSEDFAEGRAAFLAKRPPRFVGR